MLTRQPRSFGAGSSSYMQKGITSLSAACSYKGVAHRAGKTCLVTNARVLTWSNCVSVAGEDGQIVTWP